MKARLGAREHGFTGARRPSSWRTLILVASVAAIAGATAMVLRAQRAMRPPTFAVSRDEEVAPVHAVRVARGSEGIALAFDVVIDRPGPHFAYARIVGTVRGERRVVTARRRFARLDSGRTRLTLTATGASVRELDEATAPTLEYLVVADVGDHPPRPIARYGR